MCIAVHAYVCLETFLTIRAGPRLSTNAARRISAGTAIVFPIDQCIVWRRIQRPVDDTFLFFALGARWQQAFMTLPCTPPLLDGPFFQCSIRESRDMFLFGTSGALKHFVAAWFLLLHFTANTQSCALVLGFRMRQSGLKKMIFSELALALAMTEKLRHLLQAFAYIGAGITFYGAMRQTFPDGQHVLREMKARTNQPANVTEHHLAFGCPT